MDITIDTSAVLAVVCGEASRSRAIELTAGHALVAPASLPWEIGNALSAMIKRRRVTVSEANAAIDAYLAIPVRLVEVDLKHAMTFAKKLRVYAYDAYMLACAQQTVSPLLTLDNALSVHARSLGIELLEV